MRHLSVATILRLGYQNWIKQPVPTATTNMVNFG
jgi:hypothetical protein